MSPNRRSVLARRALPGLVAAALLAAPAAAQTMGDRQLLSTQGGDPYVMILFDNSGSMNWATACDADDRAAGRCAHDCTDPNCPQPRNGDDSNSKIYQAREALYTVMSDVGPGRVRWGWASLNQDQAVVAAKHWLYEVETVTISSGAASPAFPAVGWQEVFGPRSGGSGAYAFNIECDRSNPSSDNNNSALYETGCYMNTQDAVIHSAPTTWQLEKLKRLPKGGADGTLSTVYYLRDSGNSPTNYYRVTYGTVAGGVSYPTADTLTVPVTIESCPRNTVSNDSNGRPVRCGALDASWALVSVRAVTYSKVGEFLFWEGSPDNSSDLSKNAYFGGRTDGEAVSLSGVSWANTVYGDKTCRGWEPSGVYPGQSTDITEIDPNSSTSYNLNHPTFGATFDPPGTEDDWIFNNGDLIPLRWDDPSDENFTAIMKRLNPKHPTVDAESFGQAPFFADTYAGTETFLRYATDDNAATTGTDEAVRTIVSQGSTPLAGWFSMFRRWYSGCGDPGKCDSDFTGWQDIAAQYDTTFNCSKKYVLMITDGEESCDGSPQAPAENYYDDNIEEFPDGFSKTADQCRYRASLRAQEGIETIVIGFGVENKAKLQCANTPVFYADTKGELIDLLEELLGEILEDAASFASAAVPTVQTNILDKIYLSSFIPLEGESVWPGRLDAFLKPLPLDTSNLPDRAAECADGQQSECFAWDAADSQLAWNGEAGYQPEGFLLQAPLPSEITRYDNDTLQIGDGANERRVFFGRPDDPDDVGGRRYFQYPTSDAEWLDLQFVWNVPDDDAAPATPSATEKATMAGILEFTLQEKQSIITDPDTGTETKIQYVMGDIFHSNPVVVNPPADFDLFTKDLYWSTPLCGEDDLAAMRSARGPQISYSWYSNKNLCRRVMLAVGSNDGQLHVFDAGILRDITPDDPTTTGVDERVAADCLLNVPVNSSSYEADLFDDDGAAGDYDPGTGREIFSFIPQAMMPLVKELSEIADLTTQYGIDGTTRIADVFIDPAPTAGVPTCEERTWRTLMFGSYREGGPGIFALDITQPDVFDSDNIPRPLDDTPSYVPSCIDGGAGCDDFCASGDADCAALPFPALKWEFRDLDENGNPADDDGNGVTDLAESWSRPLVVRHPVCLGECDADDEPEDRWLAIFGGGLPELPSNDASETAGNWLYMVDIETGEVLYKRGGSGAGTTSPIVGAVPSDITGVDSNVDGIFDTLYFGTTAGYVYKVVLGDDPFELGDDATDPATYGRLVDPEDDAGKFDPFQVFDTGGRPIYLEVNTVYVPKMRANAILFGTGIRWDLWANLDQEGRFYSLLDDDWQDANRDGVVDPPCASCAVPMTESLYQAIDPDDTVTATANFLYGVVPNKLPGWYFTLESDEKLITEPFTLTGVTFFTVFVPLETENDDGSCSRSGESKIFVVNAVTTEGYAIQAGATERTRYTIASTFTTQPFVESSATKNAPTSSSSANADTWTTELAEINADLRKLFPAGVRFANYTLDIKTIRKDTGIVFIAPVPVAIEPHNWREF
jgi:hypothetical protein